MFRHLRFGHLNFNLTPYFNPPDGDEGGSGGDDDNSLTDRQILDAPDEDEDEDDGADGDEGKPDEAEGDGDPDVVTIEDEDAEGEGDEDGEEDEEEDGSEEEEQDDENIVTAPRFRDLKKAFPEIFKKFPTLAAVIKDEREFKSVFGSIDEAKEAQQQSEFFRNLESTIMSGDAETFIDSVRKGNEASFNKFTVDLVERVRESDDKLYATLTAPALIGVLRNAVAAAEGSGNTNLKHAAGYISKFIFGTTTIPDVRGRVKDEVNPENDKLKQDREKFENEKLADFQNDVLQTGYGEVDKVVTASLDPKDPRIKTLTPYLKNQIVRDVRVEVNNRLANDVRHNRTMDSLFDKAKKANFNRESRREFITAYLRAAKAVLPTATSKVLKDALGPSKGKRDERIPNNQPARSGERRVEQPRREEQVQRQSKRVPTARDVDWTRTSDRMFLDDKFVPRSRGR